MHPNRRSLLAAAPRSCSPRPDRPIVLAVYTQGGRPTDAQLEAVFAAVGRAAGERLG